MPPRPGTLVRMSQPRPGEKTHDPVTWEPSRAFLRNAVWCILLGEAVYLFVLLRYTPEQWFRASGPVLMTIVGLAGAYLLRRGSTVAALNLLAYGAWAAITTVALINGGIRVPLLYAYPLVILLAGWLISGRAAVRIAVVTSVTSVALVVAERNGLLRQAPEAPLALFAVAQIFVNALSAVLVISLTKAYRNRLDELDAVTREFAQRTSDLEVTRSELQRAQAVATVGSWVYDLGPDTMRLSNETCRIFGLPEGTVGNYAAYLSRTVEQDRDALQRAWHQGLKGEGLDYEHRIRVRDEIRWIRLKAQMATAGDGNTRQAVGTVQDITERKLADLDLRQSQKRFSTAFSSSPVSASIATADDGRFLEANDNFERDFGWAKSELIGRTTIEVGIWPDPAARHVWADVIRSTGRVVDYETTWLHKNGEQRRVSISGEIIEIDGQACVLAYTTDITARKLAEEQIRSLAFFDPLTKLPNRRLLSDRLEHALASAQRHQRHGALLFIDLDNFKTLNDTHGHDMGDMLLQQVAQRLSAAVRECDTVARQGGDEFVVMLEDLSANPIEAATQAKQVAEKLVGALNEHYALGRHSHHGTPSIGVTLFGAEPEHIEEPLKRADLAMYQAKAAGRNTVRFFDPQMQAVVSARASLEIGLREALAKRQFVLHYQPQVRGGREVMGVEALVRWVHPERGLVSPAEFIALAEETGLILPLGSWVLETACMQLAAWARQPRTAGLSISINVSARQFHQADFVDEVLRVIAQTGADPARLKLELTESLMVASIEDVIAKMSALRERGVGFSLDDFGTGYSSLAYLKQLPLDQIKIDRSFVRDILVDPNDAAIARMVIVLAETLGLLVIAEGVETAAQQQALLALGCNACQGYLFSRPLPVAEFEAYLGRGQCA
jgi:diguanylate cyclase (GGDEF)-like protein/PAS domain S-box-containing protein